MCLQATEMSLWEFMSLVKNHTPAREVMATTAMEAAGLTIDEGIISKHLMKPSDPVRWTFVCSIIPERKHSIPWYTMVPLVYHIRDWVIRSSFDDKRSCDLIRFFEAVVSALFCSPLSSISKCISSPGVLLCIWWICILLPPTPPVLIGKQISLMPPTRLQVRLISMHCVWKSLKKVPF